MEDDEIELIDFDPSRDEILGVFNNLVHVKKQDCCIMLIPRKEYLRVWNIWLDGKQRYCENWNEYCGVMGYTQPLNIEKQKPIMINEWSQSDEDMRQIEYNVYLINKFEDTCDFEHG